MKYLRRPSFIGIVRIFCVLMLMTLIAFTAYAFVVNLERGNIQNAITLGGMVVIMVPIAVVFITTKF